jgi:N-glycosylase/DNA lyase
MTKELKKDYFEKKIDLQRKLKDFKKLNEKEWFYEFVFCHLTPQSNAQRCWEAVEMLSKIDSWNEENIKKILITKTRFHNNKTKYLLNVKNNWEKILPKIKKEKTIELRNFIAKNIKGLGLKEASHFLRNIGKSNNEIAILDRHILRNLKNNNLINEDKIKNNKNYLELEKIYLEFSKSMDIPPDELDLLWWSQENGQIFK